MMKEIFGLLVLVGAFVGFGCALSLDPVASADLEQFIKDDFVISMRHIRPRRKFQIAIEALFMIDFPTLKHKFSFFLDRKQTKVTLDIASNSITHSKHFDMPGINETSTIRSLALMFSGVSLTLYIDCKESSKIDIDIGLSKLYLQMDEPVINLFRERKYPLHFDSSIDRALNRANCQKGFNRRANKKFLKNKLSDKEKNKKRDTSWYHSGNERDRDRYRESETNNELYRRGDIPILHGDCDDALTKAIQDLIALVKQLRDDIAYQRGEIGHLRTLIENCAGCREKPRDNCQNANPCFSGVQCYDTATGTRCGHCPRGYVGDGKSCRPGVTCADRPCFQNVHCYDTVEGAQCGPCPSGYEGDGQTCMPQNVCRNSPCASGMAKSPIVITP